tara:strand:+ start:14004 stop:14726 length:723 start_codon:yes stop_codon:yes gene_type:complete
MKKTAIVIPAYNEDKNILKLIKKIREKINSLIVIVDDSPNFKTKEIIRSIKTKNIIYLHRGKKLGRGSAVIFGFKTIIKKNKNIDCFIEMDADMSHQPSELFRNIRFFHKNSLDLLIGSRYQIKSKIVNWPLSRKVLSKLSNTLAKLLLRIPVSDYTNGYRFYSKRAVKTIILKCNKLGGGFIILSEIILVLHKKNYKISEISSIFINRVRGESSVNFYLIFESFFGLIKLFFLKIFNKI